MDLMTYGQLNLMKWKKLLQIELNSYKQFQKEAYNNKPNYKHK